MKSLMDKIHRTRRA